MVGLLVCWSICPSVRPSQKSLKGFLLCFSCLWIDKKKPGEVNCYLKCLFEKKLFHLSVRLIFFESADARNSDLMTLFIFSCRVATMFFFSYKYNMYLFFNQFLHTFIHCSIFHLFRFTNHPFIHFWDTIPSRLA